MEAREFAVEDLLGELNAVERKNAPKRLFVSGDTALLRRTRVSVVGSRKASAEGRKRAEILVRALVKRGIVVVSGLADGIDTIAHEAAIAAGGSTIAVLGTPLDRCFPARNRDLQGIIARDHLLISQFPLGYPSSPKNFPIRNRTMALVSAATIIVEAGEKSGTRHQGWEALRLGRYVFMLENVAADPALSWPKELRAYGAEILTRDNLEWILDEMPPIDDGERIAL